MLVTFKCRSTANVVMLRNLAEYLLSFIGKEVADRGVISHEELALAIPKLEGAIREEARSEVALNVLHHVPHDHGTVNQEASVEHRAWPLIDMMRKARLTNDDILWGV